MSLGQFFTAEYSYECAEKMNYVFGNLQFYKSHIYRFFYSTAQHFPSSPLCHLSACFPDDLLRMLCSVKANQKMYLSNLAAPWKPVYVRDSRVRQIELKHSVAPSVRMILPVARAGGLGGLSACLGSVGLCLVCVCLLSSHLNVSHCLCGCASLRL